MISGSSTPVRRRAWRWWLGLLLACGAFTALRFHVEARRLHDLAQWENDQLLKDKFWSIAFDRYETVVEKLAPGKTFPRKTSLGPYHYQFDLPAGYIEPRFEGWKLQLTFSRRSGSDFETLNAMTVVPPANLPSEPSELWWAVEHAREALLCIAVIGWVAGLVLIASIRGARRRIAPVCFAAALLCMFSASLERNFEKKLILSPLHHAPQPIVTGRYSQYRSSSMIANYSGWFDTGGVMAFLALMIGIVPARQSASRGCAHCGYDLTGNESGICPECGTETQKSLREKRFAELAPAADRLVHIDEPVNGSENEPEGELRSEPAGKLDPLATPWTSVSEDADA